MIVSADPPQENVDDNNGHQNDKLQVPQTTTPSNKPQPRCAVESMETQPEESQPEDQPVCLGDNKNDSAKKRKFQDLCSQSISAKSPRTKVVS